MHQFSITYYVYIVFDTMKKRKRRWSYALTWLQTCSPYIDNRILWCNIWCISFLSKGGFYGTKVSSSCISKVELHCRCYHCLPIIYCSFILELSMWEFLMAFWCMDSLGILWLFSCDKMKLNNKQEPVIMPDNSQTMNCLVCWPFPFSC